MSRRVLTSSWPAMIVAGVGIVLVLLKSEVPVDSLLRYAGYLAICVALPGVIAWRLLLASLHVDDDTSPTWFEDLTLGTIFGFGLQLPFFLAGVAIGFSGLVFALPVLVLLVAVTTPHGRRGWRLPTGHLDVRASWALTVVILYGLAWLGRNAFPLRPLSLAPNASPSIDETFHQALVADIANRFPPEIPFLLGTRLDYHWFVHAQIATSNSVTGLESVLMLRDLMPVLGLVLAILGLGAVALRLTGRPVAAFIAPALMVAGAFHLNGPNFGSSYFIEPYLSARYVSSPSQSYGVMMSMPAVMLLLEVLRPRTTPSRLSWLTLALALLALSGSKATFMPVFLCGAIAVWCIHLLVHRRIDKTASALVVLLVLVTAFAQYVLFGGQGGGLALDPFETVRAALHREDIAVTHTAEVVMSLSMLVSWLLYGVGAFGLLRGRMWLDARAVWMLVAVPTGIAVPFLLFRSGLSQLWFSRTVAELVVLISAWGMACLLPKPLTTRHAAFLTGIAAAAGLSAFAVSSLVESRSDGVGATLGSLLLTVVAPFAVAVAFLVTWLIARLTPRRRRPGVVVLLAFLLGLSTVNVASYGYDALTKPTRVHKAGEPLFAGGGVDAATYITEHSPPSDIVATNVHCARPMSQKCDNRNFWIAAFTERRIVVEGWGYTAATNVAAKADTPNAYLPVPDIKRLKINDAAFERPSAETVRRLVDSYDVSWLFISKKYPADIEGLRQLDDLLGTAFENGPYVVFKVRT
ncbi:MAG: hypothetical protein H0T17_03825 [Propionibacteriales bacterium]|nr:hypothetical protein [Propionibacteriales bacterium]